MLVTDAEVFGLEVTFCLPGSRNNSSKAIRTLKVLETLLFWLLPNGSKARTMDGTCVVWISSIWNLVDFLYSS